MMKKVLVSVGIFLMIFAVGWLLNQQNEHEPNQSKQLGNTLTIKSINVLQQSGFQSREYIKIVTP